MDKNDPNSNNSENSEAFDLGGLAQAFDAKVGMLQISWLKIAVAGFALFSLASRPASQPFGWTGWVFLLTIIYVTITELFKWFGRVQLRKLKQHLGTMETGLKNMAAEFQGLGDKLQAPQRQWPEKSAANDGDIEMDADFENDGDEDEDVDLAPNTSTIHSLVLLLEAPRAIQGDTWKKHLGQALDVQFADTDTPDDESEQMATSSCPCPILWSHRPAVSVT